MACNVDHNNHHSKNDIDGRHNGNDNVRQRLPNQRNDNEDVRIDRIDRNDRNERNERNEAIPQHFNYNYPNLVNRVAWLMKFLLKLLVYILVIVFLILVVLGTFTFIIEFIHASKIQPINKNNNRSEEKTKNDRNSQNKEEELGGDVSTDVKTKPLDDKQREILADAFNTNIQTQQGNQDAIIKAKDAIDSLYFQDYNYRSQCDFMNGIPIKKFKATVTKVAKLLQLPEALTETIIDAGDQQSKADAIKIHTFGTKNSLYFGRFSVVHLSDDLLAFSYSLSSLTFELAPKEIQDAEKVSEFVKFIDSMANSPNENQSRQMAYFANKGTEHFVDYYLDLSARDFEKDCAGKKNVFVGAPAPTITEEKSSTIPKEETTPATEETKEDNEESKEEKEENNH